MVVGFTTTCVISAFHHYRYEFEFHSIVVLYGLFIKKKFLADHRVTDFTLSKICGTSTKNTSHLSTVISQLNAL
jgi:hypothetical protein